MNYVKWNYLDHDDFGQWRHSVTLNIALYNNVADRVALRADYKVENLGIDANI